MKRQVIALLLGATALYPLSARAQGNETQTQMNQPDKPGQQAETDGQQRPAPGNGGQSAQQDTREQSEPTGPVAKDTPEPTVVISVAQLDERDITNESGEIVGEIEQVMRDEYGSISVVFSHGGYLGIGEKQILVPVDWLSLRGNDLIVRLTAEQITEMEDWEGAPGYEALPPDQSVTISRDRE